MHVIYLIDSQKFHKLESLNLRPIMNISIKEKKAQSPHLLGTWSISSSPAVIESIGYSGMDFVILDMEHGDMSFETVTQSVRAAETADLSSIVRVQELNSSTIFSC